MMLTARQWLRSQIVLLAVWLSVSGIQWFLSGHASVLSTFIYTFVSGTTVEILTRLAHSFYDRPSPQNWFRFGVILLPISLAASLAGGIVNRLILHRSLVTLRDPRGDVPYATLLCAVVATLIYLFDHFQARMEAANQQLSQEVQQGKRELATHASELQAAFEIQSNLLPRSIPQITGVEISCAWQPARVVSGDFFDVVILADTRIGFCLADVSGKGMSAALVTANLQAAFRAIVHTEASPAALCRRLNQALCTNLPVGRFVTLVYGILDRKNLTLTYEVAGHAPPVVLRGDEVLELPGSGSVLGLFPEFSFSDHTVTLRPGDRLLLSTDGVTEAFSPIDEEFGQDRLVAAAIGAPSGSAHSTRTEIMSAVKNFAAGNFHDDASLMVIHVQP